MAEDNGKKKRAEQPDKKTGRHDFGHEIWGILFFALGILLTISLCGFLIDPKDHLLGRYVGTFLASGLIYFFGIIPAFVVPCSLFVFGLSRWRRSEISGGSAVSWAAITVLTCTLFAIHNLPRMLAPFTITENLLGNDIVKQLFKIFGVHPFGPYFIFSTALLITFCIALRINPRRIVTPLMAALRRGIAWLRERVVALFANRPTAATPEAPPEGLFAPEPKPRKKGEGESTKPEKPEKQLLPATQTQTQTQPKFPDIAQDIDESVEDEAKAALDAELAAFREKKKQPITISTVDVAPVETDIVYDDNNAALPNALLLKTPGKKKEKELEQAPLKLVESTEPLIPLEKYKVPLPEILSTPPVGSDSIDRVQIETNSAILEKTLFNFGVEGKVVNVCPGPVITRYEIELAPGVKVSRIVSLQDDISMAVGGQKIRIEAPIPGKAAIGIELPNAERQIVHFKHILLSDQFTKNKSKLPIVIGRNISGQSFATDIAKMPHLLIAGQTGSGKSVCINTLICSLLMTKTPEELRLIMIDPKKVELASYEGIPHLLSPVVTESKEAVKALQWGVLEMERRYRMLAKVGARNIETFNQRVESGKIKEGILLETENKLLPFVVIIVDELADLMMTASKDVESLIQRIAQLARAVGIHLIVATQRPSVDIITGPIKANLTSRIAFRTIQSTDSRTILGHVGAEKLLGMGDMLFLRSGAPDMERFHGAFISEEDVETIVSKVRSQNVAIEKIQTFEEAVDGPGESGGGLDDERDELFEEAAHTVVSLGQGSTSLLQRRMKIGYARAGRLMDELHLAGIVGPQEGSKTREVLVQSDELEIILGKLSGDIHS